MPRKRGLTETRPTLRSSDEVMNSSFGTYLKDYDGRNWKGRLAARHWRTALRNDYLTASHYLTESEVLTRLRMWEGEPVHVANGVSVVWLEYRTLQRLAEAEK